MSEENVVLKTGCITPDACPDDIKQHGWTHARRYVVKGAGGGGWTAHLVVGARELDVLTQFRPEYVMTKMAYAHAWSKQGLLVFKQNAFHKMQQHQNHLYAFRVDEFAT
ncbi:hypothetical protein ColTof4_03443 [Colletotrichum tofieldiae]|uniref:Uncharacterized protein n=1 Tax=Colletotrichum tofieldiae TaxID=708197 RepID=A0A161YMR9_9PEZI|nr:hypothetical protein CT0861_04292 [Colletotrichum tofieldiae]GKT65798.1 hypothetical protein ColTof3_13137 [Colletotrichum tofieldiae]GKT71020.1 hypothetical protein ColTof4_03443 [Colletotrichum tofieldiae]GKT94064.1 hypothetical protein Ct61P_11914 [Colletotrichum tofieldiae]